MRNAYNRGWGYRLDYDKEIANDLREIAQAERHVALAAVLTDEERAMGSYSLNIVTFLEANPTERAPLLGITSQVELSELCELWYMDLPGLPETTAGWYSRATASAKRIESEFGDYVMRDATSAVKALKVRLARHRRNKEKFG